MLKFDLKSSNDITIKLRRKAYERNGKLNIPLIKKWGGLRRYDFKNKDVYIIGAGETLSDHYDILRECKDFDSVIIAMDMTLRPLLLNGIKPHMCVTLETNFQGYFHGLDTRGILLLAYSLSCNKNLRDWQGSIQFMNIETDDYYLNKVKKRALFKTLGDVKTGGNCLTAAMILAVSYDARRIVLIGSDLGFKNNYYAVGTPQMKKYENTTNRFKPFETYDRDFHKGLKIINRDGYYITDGLAFMRVWMEETFGEREKKVFDTSWMGMSPDKCIKIKIEVKK
jgi:hypothetical protein